MLEVKNVTKSFDGIKVVNDISFRLERGNILGVLGKNGAGKSTLFRIILDILEPDFGKVLIDGKPYTIKDTAKIGFLPEEGSLMQGLTVYEQMCFYGSLKNMTEDKVEKALEKWLEIFDITEYMNKKIKELSKGNRQRLQFIAALLHDPELIILDEPFSGLDPLGVEKFKEILLDLKSKNKAIIFSSHRMEHVELFCEDIIMIDSGNVILSGNLKEIKKNYGKVKVSDTVTEKIIEKDKAGRYVFSLDDEKKSNLKITELSLNDIFIDKVGLSDDNK